MEDMTAIGLGAAISSDETVSEYACSRSGTEGSTLARTRLKKNWNQTPNSTRNRMVKAIWTALRGLRAAAVFMRGRIRVHQHPMMRTRTIWQGIKKVNELPASEAYVARSMNPPSHASERAVAVEALSEIWIRNSTRDCGEDGDQRNP